MATQKRPIRIDNPTLKDAASRLDWFTRMADKRLDECEAATDRTERTLALLEAEVAAELVESASYEVSLRLLGHGVEFDAAREIARRLARYRALAAEHEAVYGAVVRA